MSMSSALDRLIPTPRLVEISHVELAAPPARVWELLRHRDMAKSPLVRALFAVRTLPSRMARERAAGASIRLDDLVSSPEHPGFQILVDEPPHEIAVGAIGKVWRLKIPFVHLSGVEAFAAFAEAGFIKVAWALRFLPLGESATRLVFELRVDATDSKSWRKFRRYFRVIGPASRFIRRALLAEVARNLGTPEPQEGALSLAGNEA